MAGEPGKSWPCGLVLVTGGHAAHAAAGRYDPRALEALWASLPGQMRLSCFSEASVPPQYAGAFIHGRRSWREVDLSHLPGPMRREMAWSVFRMIELGGKVPAAGLAQLAGRLGEVIAGYPPGRAPASLLDLTVPEWCQQIGHAWHRRTGRLPAPETARHLRNALTRMTRLLAIALDPGPWWQQERWSPVEDRRIPVREHEPMGRLTARFDQITLAWLRRGLQWHCKTALETGTMAWSGVFRQIVSVKVFDFSWPPARSPARRWPRAAQVRVLMLDFLAHLRTRTVTRGGPHRAAAICGVGRQDRR